MTLCSTKEVLMQFAAPKIQILNKRLSFTVMKLKGFLTKKVYFYL